MNMNFRVRALSSILKLHAPNETIGVLFPWQYQQCLQFQKWIKLKWVKNRGFDEIVVNDTELKAVFLLKHAIKRTSTGFLPSNLIHRWKYRLGLSVPVLDFLREHRTIFQEFPHPRYPSLPCFRLTDAAIVLDSEEQSIHRANELDTVERLCRILMLTNSGMIPLPRLRLLKWDLGLPDDFDTTLMEKYPDYFRVSKDSDGIVCMHLTQWREEFAFSTLQRNNENHQPGVMYRQFIRGKTELSFPMRFPKRYWNLWKVRTWMGEFQKLPYISPYQDFSFIDPHCEIMEKHIIGVFHEFLSLTINKKTRSHYFGVFKEELNLPFWFRRLFTKYPGFFYLSLKSKTRTVVLRDGYDQLKLLDPHPLACFRKKYLQVIRTFFLNGVEVSDVKAHQES